MLQDRTLMPILWDLQSELEAQLRCLTKVHVMVDRLDIEASDQRAIDVVSILKNLRDIRRTHATVEPLCAEALALAGRL